MSANKLNGIVPGKSIDIKEYESGNHGIDKIKFGDQIRFEMNLNQLNPFNLRKQLYN